MLDVNCRSVSNPWYPNCHIATITSSGGVQPCVDDTPLLQSRPGSTRSRGSSSSPVQVAQVGPTKRNTPVPIKRITPLPYIGIDRMWDFGQVGAASLWKSGPLFSTGQSSAGLMRRRASVVPAVALDGVPGWRVGEEAGKGWNQDGPKLSTAFAEPSGSPSPGPEALLHRPETAGGMS
jgi:hypothetical protein